MYMVLKLIMKMLNEIEIIKNAYYKLFAANSKIRVLESVWYE